MNQMPQPSDPGVPEKDPMGLAIASLVLGILALLLSLFLVGALFGLIGLILGIVHLAKKRNPKGMAWTGTTLSFLAILVSAGLLVAYMFMVRNVMEEMGGSGPEWAEWEGRAAPDFTMTTLDGKELALSSFKGKRVVLDFWATWCPPCRKEIPHFVQLVKETPPEDLVIVGISNEDQKILSDFSAKNGINYTMALEPAGLPPPYDGIRAIPTTFFIDRNGIIQEVKVGYHDLETLRSAATAEDVRLEAPEPVEDAGNST